MPSNQKIMIGIVICVVSLENRIESMGIKTNVICSPQGKAISFQWSMLQCYICSVDGLDFLLLDGVVSKSTYQELVLTTERVKEHYILVHETELMNIHS